jgi:hypothetical protein
VYTDRSWQQHRRRGPGRVHRWFVCASAVVAWAALSGSAAASAQAVPPRLVVVDLSPESLPAPYQDVKLGVELGRALAAAGCRIERTCTSEECARGPGETGLHVLSFDLRYDRKEFACSFSLEVRDGPGGRVEYREKASSPVCPAAEALEDSRRAARLACDELRKTVAAATPAAPAAPGPAATPSVRSQPPPAAVPSDFTEHALGAGLVAAGAVAMVAGGALLYLHGRPTSCARSPEGERVCTRTRHTTLLALPLLVVGVAGIGWGAWTLLSNREEGALVLGLDRQGLSLGGRF